MVSRGEIIVDPAMVEAVMWWPRPTTVTEVRGFLGLIGYYRRFVQEFSKMSIAMTQLTKIIIIIIIKWKPFGWTSDCEANFQELKRKLMTAPVFIVYSGPQRRA